MTPEAGTEATVPMDVGLQVSLGPPEFEMPLLLGLEEAEAVLHRVRKSRGYAKVRDLPPTRRGSVAPPQLTFERKRTHLLVRSPSGAR